MYPDATGMIVRAWDTLANGYDFEFTRNWLDQPQWWYYQRPNPDGPNLRHPNYRMVAPYFNWRFWGTRNNPLF